MRLDLPVSAAKCSGRSPFTFSSSMVVHLLFKRLSIQSSVGMLEDIPRIDEQATHLNTAPSSCDMDDPKFAS